MVQIRISQKKMMNPRVSNLRFARAPRTFTFFFAISIAIALFTPMNFVIITPGDPSPLFPKILSINDSSGSDEIKSYPANGQLYLLTILVTNPDTHVLGAAIAGCWVWGDCVVVPRSAIYQRDTSNEKEIEVSKEEMDTSQNVALSAAKNQLATRFPEIDLSQVDESTVKVSLENTGGPSGGLIFALGIVELFTPTDILQGRKIAGTGTISATGEVGPIGGVVEKIIGAKKVGAELLFISKANCDELPSEVEGITVIAVESLDQVVTYLVKDSQESKQANSAGIQGCASVRA
jgi:PDZ domain-containing protein